MEFPIDLAAFEPLALDPSAALGADERKKLAANIALCRDAIVFFTAVGGARGVGGHTGGAFDVVPEMLIADAWMRGPAGERIVPVLYDEAGHRVAIQYLMSVLRKHMPADRLLHYREAHAGLPGHPERGLTPGVDFSSGRLGHLWAFCNGVARANPNKAVFLFGSDGSQLEGDDAEAARLAVAQKLEVKLVLDDNDITIVGNPRQYMPGFDMAKTLAGHGLQVASVGKQGEREASPEAIYEAMRGLLTTNGPAALINHRKMAPSVEGIEGTSKGHDCIAVEPAIAYLTERGHTKAVEYLKQVAKPSRPSAYRGVAKSAWGQNRNVFGQALCEQIATIPATERAKRVLVMDNDLAGSCGLSFVQKEHPDVYVEGGPMERGNFSTAAGFGNQPGRQGVFATFSAFLEMLISEITMARLNDANVLAHFSHAGIDDMADNNCHFGVNNLFADNGLAHGNAEGSDSTRLYFPADQHQMRAVVARVFGDAGLRFVFSTRSPVPDILDERGKPRFGDGYTFEPGRDEIIREGKAGWIVSYGEMVFRALDAVERLREDGLDVGLVHKPTLNVVDEAMMTRLGASPFVLLVESQSRTTGLGARFGTWLLERGHAPRYAHLGTQKSGCGGLWEQMAHQGLDPDGIVDAVRKLAR